VGLRRRKGGVSAHRRSARRRLSPLPCTQGRGLG
jgi:hypothetical protein